MRIPLYNQIRILTFYLIKVDEGAHIGGFYTQNRDGLSNKNFTRGYEMYQEAQVSFLRCQSMMKEVYRLNSYYSEAAIE
jgi:hypothetical protein